MPNKPKAYRGDEPFVFVSYAHADTELAYPIISGLQERGMRIWFDDGLDAGDDWEDVIPDHVEQCAAMLCLVSTRFAGSKNCKNEIRYASELNKVLLILHLETGELPRHIRFHYSAIHVLRLSDYSDHSALLDKLSVSQKLRCCMGASQRSSAQPEMSPGELYQKGEAYYYGRGVSQSYEEAVKWYRRAADRGNARAMYALGFCYDLGEGVSQSYEEAVKWYRRAADQGNADAMCDLGYCYYAGNGVSRSYEKAVEWYCRAMDKGSARAMCDLGICYEKGNGVPQSWALAVVWYRRAADQGHVTAMRNLGNCYANGRGVSKDQKQADYWYNKANEVEDSK